MQSRGPTITQLEARAMTERVDALGDLLHACVHDGASVGFVLPFPLEAAHAFWRQKVLPGVEAGGRLLWVAEAAGRVVATVQLSLDTPPNQPHRAEIAKLLVHPEHRRQGIARALMSTAEGRACALGRSLITLDTRTGDAAEPLYASIGYATVGVIPDYCRNPFDGRLEGTTVMYKTL